MTDQLTMLCVDDEVNILKSLRRLMRNEPYRVLTANSGAEGLEILKTTPVQLIVSDQRMPELNGTEFLKQAKELYPDTIRVVLSGYADVAAILEAINEGSIYRFLTKPWNDEEIKVAIRQCFEHYTLLEDHRNMAKKLEQQNTHLLELTENLQKALNAHSSSLQFTHEILQSLPVPIIGVDCEGIVTMVNSAVSDYFPELDQVHMGMHCHEVFPGELARIFAEALNGADAELKVNTEKAVVTVRRIHEDIHVRGCLMIMEPNSCPV